MWGSPEFRSPHIVLRFPSTLIFLQFAAFFPTAESYSSSCVDHIFIIHSLPEAHLGWFRFIAPLYGAATNKDVCAKEAISRVHRQSTYSPQSVRRYHCDTSDRSRVHRQSTNSPQTVHRVREDITATPQTGLMSKFHKESQKLNPEGKTAKL